MSSLREIAVRRGLKLKCIDRIRRVNDKVVQMATEEVKQN